MDYVPIVRGHHITGKIFESAGSVQLRDASRVTREWTSFLVSDSLFSFWFFCAFDDRSSLLDDPWNVRRDATVISWSGLGFCFRDLIRADSSFKLLAQISSARGEWVILLFSYANLYSELQFGNSGPCCENSPILLVRHHQTVGYLNRWKENPIQTIDHMGEITSRFLYPRGCIPSSCTFFPRN